MTLIILEDANGKRRKVAPGRQIEPPLGPGEKVVGIERDEWQTPTPYKYKKCSHCGEMGVFEYT